MKALREQFIEWLFKHSQNGYTGLFKHHASWGISRTDLLRYPKDSFGRHRGLFLDKHDFELIAKVERHDAYHALTGFGTQVADEIALQWLCFGNGKRSPYLYGAIILGTVILPDYWAYYIASYKLGKNANPFHQLDYKKLLQLKLQDLRAAFFSKRQQIQLTQLKHTTHSAILKSNQTQHMENST
jgi:hypothetical protein